MLSALVPSAELNAPSPSGMRPVCAYKGFVGAKEALPLPIPSSAEIGPALAKKTAAAIKEALPLPAPWAGLSRALTVGDLSLVASEAFPTGVQPAPVVTTVDTPVATSVQIRSPRQAAPDVLPAFEIARAHRERTLSRERAESGASTSSWTGISNSLEADFGSASPVAPPRLVPSKLPDALIIQQRVADQPAVVPRRPRAVSSPAAPLQPATWRGLSNEMDAYGGASPSPQSHRRVAAKAVKQTVKQAHNLASKENAASEYDELIPANPPPPAASFGYSDLSPLAIIAS